MYHKLVQDHELRMVVMQRLLMLQMKQKLKPTLLCQQLAQAMTPLRLVSWLNITCM